MARLVRVQGESEYTHVLDLDLNPWAEEQIARKTLRVVEELDGLPPDPWASKTPPRGATKAARERAAAEAEAAAEAADESAAEADGAAGKSTEE